MNNDLQAITALLAAQHLDSAAAVDQLVQGQIRAGGKMLRAKMLLQFARFGVVVPETRQIAAAAVEALHLATLLHDDVLDDAATRRGVPTIAPSCGNRAAIYAGDFMFAVYFDLLAQMALPQPVVAEHAAVMQAIFLGELAQNSAPHAVSLRQYLKQSAGKTAALFGLSAYTGAYLAGLDASQCLAARRFGRLFGMAFQMQDDIQDATFAIGKPTGQDFARGIDNLPSILTRQSGVMLTPNTIQAIGVPKAQVLARTYRKKSRQQLLQLPDWPARAVLMQMVGVNDELQTVF